MILDLLAVVGGFALLTGGGELLVRGASGVSEALKLPARVVGLLIVSVGTSLPELVVSVGAGLRGAPEIAVGNVVGSNIYNVLLILGLCALVRPLRVTAETLRGDWPATMAAMVALWLCALDGVVGRLEGAALCVGFCAYVVWTVRRSQGQTTPVDGVEAAPSRTARAGVEMLGGIVLLVGGAELVVGGASTLAGGLGVSDRVIALTVVAIGTSFPELVTSLIATIRGNDDVAVANVVGSNLFNALGIAGVSALILPLQVSQAAIWRDMPVMLGSFLLLFPLLWTGRVLSRIEGGLLLSLALGYTAWLLAA